jgi:hypothetical protein
MPPSYGNAPVWAIHQILIIQITLWQSQGP